MSTLPEAQAEFEREFKRVVHDPNIRDVLHLYSGGTVPDIKTTAPCLCSTEELAIKLWHRTADNAWLDFVCDELASAKTAIELAGLKGRISVTWRQPPKMVKFQMTMTDLKKQDRVVTDRFAVYCEVAFSL